MPVHFGNFAEESRAVRESVGLIDLSHRGDLSLKGPDSVRFLHGQCTNDIQKLAAGSGCPVAFLTPKGKLICDGEALAFEDGLRIGCEPAMSGALLAHLKKFAVFDKVEIADASASRLLFSIQGRQAASWLHSLFGDRLPLAEPLAHATFDWNGIPVTAIRSNRIGEPGADLKAPAERSVELLDLLLAGTDAAAPRLFGTNALEILRVEAGIPKILVDMDENNLPNEARLEAAISYNKGCYTGQETVARLKTYGHVNKLLVGFLFDQEFPPPPGSPLFVPDQEARPAGKITSSIFSPWLGRVIALGYAPRDHSSPGDQLRLENGAHATITTLPFVPGASH